MDIERTLEIMGKLTLAQIIAKLAEESTELREALESAPKPAVLRERQNNLTLYQYDEWFYGPRTDALEGTCAKS